MMPPYPVIPTRFMYNEDIHKLLSSWETGWHYACYIAEALKELIEGRVRFTAPPKQVFDFGADGDYRVMPCTTVDAEGKRLSTVKIIGTNAKRDINPEVTVGKFFVLDQTNNIAEIWDAEALSAARTAAVGFQFFRVAMALARVKNVWIYGAGRIGRYISRYVYTYHGHAGITFLDTDMKKAIDTANSVGEYLGKDIDVLAPWDAEREGYKPEVVFMATTSREPIITPDWFKGQNVNPKVVISLGADTYDQAEIDPAVLHNTPLVLIDTNEAREIGDLGRMHVCPNTADLMEVFGRKVMLRFPVIGISTGSALFDHITAKFILQNRGHSDG